MRRRTWHRAFTLIELLVVISIIAMLAAILFPVFGRARENGRRSVCQSNLKQIGTAVQQYVQDYDERFPLQSDGDQVEHFADNDAWIPKIQPYVKSSQLFVCPSSKRSSNAPVGQSENSYFAHGLLFSQHASHPTTP